MTISWLLMASHVPGFTAVWVGWFATQSRSRVGSPPTRMFS